MFYEIRIANSAKAVLVFRVPDAFDAFGSIARGGCAAQPAPGLCQLVHIIPDALCNGLPLQLAEHRCDVHHGTSHWAGGIKAFPDGHKVDAKTLYGILLDRMGLSVKNGWLDERTRLEAYFMQSLEVDLLLRVCPDEEDFCRLRAAYIRAFASCKGMIY